MRSTADKLKIFGRIFTGLTNVYGTYDPRTGRSRQVKKPVSNRVFLDHLLGLAPYGIYLLNDNKTRALVVDFDSENRLLPVEFINSARHYKISAYIERSKSKGYHVWIFFSEQGVPATKARLVTKHILDEIEALDTEIFPKQDELSNTLRFGNFINAPLFGPLVPKGKTVFVDPATFKPYQNQWSLLESVNYVSEQTLDDIIEINELANEPQLPEKATSKKNTAHSSALPACAQTMLQDGVSQFQRVSCFRLAVHLKRLGIPQDITIAVLKVWSQKNRPTHGKQIITNREVIEQTTSAYKNNYQGYGCQSEEVRPFCNHECPVHKKYFEKSGESKKLCKVNLIYKKSCRQ